MSKNLTFSSYFVIGVMLFALFFGAGNLIFPASLGQNAGTNIWPAVFGFLITGTGLPFLGVLAMGFSGSRNLQELASRIHPWYGIIFTALLYLTIGPFFAAPRTGAVAFDIGISPFIEADFTKTGLFIFTFIFFAVTTWLSLNPSKLVDRIGKILAPGIIILLAVLLITALVNPIGSIESPQEAYASGAFVKGFMEGYNTMDALASLVFGIIVINAISSIGVTTKAGVLSATIKSGIVAIFFLSVIYVGIAFLGATSTKEFGLFETGGPVLSHASTYYFGTFGSIILAIIIILACLTTSIGLMTACGEYFHTLIPKVSYKWFVIFFSLLSFIIANFGLANIINYSIPILMFLYPLAVVLMLLTFLSPLFNHARLVYVSVAALTFCISIIDGFKTFCDLIKIPYFDWMLPIISFYEQTLPLYKQGLGWLVPALVAILITGTISRLAGLTASES
ncbi:branched-chain amino acid transport system II carrier protein [Siminovitchia sp. FSL H7-0308]|uniref:Branched-chain amino acid transport system carrier protein n=1 Tax=Siminovitchia thermophila TaxID=1245522 RepID=A0ABS2R2Q1_9BACI|nr:branched-chain amino acid transport system II carrier protein [Siminovitchia thermophila]MBM7713907.1 LIVCS family branched-chain amino acid:cation transporter [Siminovitchia thermophila]ONK22466.1 branched-chain amino acid transport system II carrier protein [Bacillus sp. VT-16-64]